MSNTSKTTNHAWSPAGDDHLIYEWVKMQGKTQADVACLLRVHQSTISRVIQRYERWQAHAKARENGDLDHAERLRAQHRLTFERNELILTSCLRIAREIEGFTDVSKSTVSRPMHNYSQEREIRTQHATIDRTGTVARFLRLAYRINMDQLKLAALDEPPPAESLSESELAEQASLAVTDAALISAALGRNPASADVGWAVPTASKPDSAGEVHPTNPNLAPSPTHHSPTHHSTPPHNLHTENPPQIAATQSTPCTCAANIIPEKNSIGRIIDHDPPPWLGDERLHSNEAEGGHSPPYNRCALPFAPAV